MLLKIEKIYGLLIVYYSYCAKNFPFCTPILLFCIFPFLVKLLLSKNCCGLTNKSFGHPTHPYSQFSVTYYDVIRIIKDRMFMVLCTTLICLCRSQKKLYKCKSFFCRKKRVNRLNRCNMNEQIDSFNASRNCVFIDLNTTVITKMKALEESNSATYENKDCKKHPTLEITFPPLIEPRDLIVKPANGGKPPRAPNAFIIYRKIFVETAKDSGYHLPMTVISSMASKSWEDESEMVKSHYKRLASEAYKYRNELYPKLERRKKRSRWNIISFQPQPERQEQRQQPPNGFSNDFSKTPELATSSSDSSPVVDNFSPIFLSSPVEEGKGITDSGINERFDFHPSGEFDFQTEFYPTTISNNSFPVNNDAIPNMNEQFCFDHDNSSAVEQFSPSNHSNLPPIQQAVGSGFSNMNINDVNNNFIAYNQLLLENYNRFFLQNMMMKSIVSESSDNDNDNSILGASNNYPSVIINNDALGISQFSLDVPQYSNLSENSD